MKLDRFADDDELVQYMANHREEMLKDDDVNEEAQRLSFAMYTGVNGMRQTLINSYF